MGRAHYQEIPKFWDEICEKYAANVYAGNEPANPYEKAIWIPVKKKA